MQKELGGVKKPHEALSASVERFYVSRMQDFSKEIWPGGGQGEEVQALQGGAGQAAVQGLNQLNQASPSYWRWWLAQLASCRALRRGRVWQELQPSLARVGRLEKLVSWLRPVHP